MGTNLGGITWFGRKMHFGGSSTCEDAPYEERKEKHVAVWEGLSPKATRRLMRWQKQEQCWMIDLWQKPRAETVQQEREEVYAALQYAASFHCLVEEWTDSEELRPKPKEKWVFVEKKSENTKHRTERCAEADKIRCMRCGRGSK